MHSPGDGTTEEREAPSYQRIGALVALPALLGQLGADPEAVFAQAGVDPAAFAEREARIPYAQLGGLLETCARATRHPQFGLLAGRMWHLEDLGVLGDVARHSATVGEALQALTVHQHLNSGGGVAFMLKRAAIVDFGYAIYCPGITGAEQIYDGVLACIFNFLRELAGPTWLPTEVFLPHAHPGDAALHRSFFKVTPRFDSEMCAVRFPAYWLERPVRSADPVRRREAMTRAHALDRQDLQSQIRRGLRRLLLTGKSSGDDLAEMLSMHRRTLNRRLREQGTTFQEVLDEVRFEVARQLLSYSHVALDDIAASLGYAGVSPFMRTFRRWTGVTPGQWRREAARRAVPVDEAPRRADFSPLHPAVPLAAPQGKWRGRARAPEPVGAMSTLGRDRSDWQGGAAPWREYRQVVVNAIDNS